MESVLCKVRRSTIWSRRRVHFMSSLIRISAANARPTSLFLRRCFAEHDFRSNLYTQRYLSRFNPTIRCSSYTPSSMVTLRHQGFSPFSINISSASPTCRLSDTSRLTWPLSLSRMALSARKLFAPLPLRASPRDGDPDPERISSLETQPPSLVTGSCYWRGSDEELRRLRCR